MLLARGCFLIQLILFLCVAIVIWDHERTIRRSVYHHAVNHGEVYHRRHLAETFASTTSSPSGIYYAPTQTAIDGQFVIVFNRDVTDDDMTLAMVTSTLGIGGIIQKRVYQRAIKAVSIFVSNDSDLGDNEDGSFGPTEERIRSAFGTLRKRRQDRLFERLIQSPFVQFIEQEQVVYAQTVQKHVPSYGLDRIDQLDDVLDGRYKYEYTGAGVTVYVLDTGIRSTHKEFLDSKGKSRVTCGINLYSFEEDCEDYDKHGTHVAAIIGGKTFGVAKKVDLVTVKVLDRTGTGSTGSIIAGLEFVIQDSQQRRRVLGGGSGADGGLQQQQQQHSGGRMVVNMSLTANLSEALNLATQQAEAAGILMTAAAGNQKTTACDYSPASSEYVLTVAGSNMLDQVYSRSNYGSCVNLFAPGQLIWSAVNDDDQATGIMSGTSQASAHVAGVAALYWEMDPTIRPAQLRQRILKDAIVGAISNPGDSPNLLVSTVELNSMGGVITMPKPSSDTTEPSAEPTFVPTHSPSLVPTSSAAPTKVAASAPSTVAFPSSRRPSPMPQSAMPTITTKPSLVPTISPAPTISIPPSTQPTISSVPSIRPTHAPSTVPSTKLMPTVSSSDNTAASDLPTTMSIAPGQWLNHGRLWITGPPTPGD